MFLHTVCGPCNPPHRDGAASLPFTPVSFHSRAIKSLLPSVRPHQALVIPRTEPKPSLHAAKKLKCESMRHPPSHPPSSTPSLARQKAPYCLIPGPDEDCEETEWLRNQQAGLPVFQKDQLHLSLSPQRTPDAWISASWASARDSFSTGIQPDLRQSFPTTRASRVTQTVKNSPAKQETRFNPWVGKMPWRREWVPTPAFLPREFHGQRSLVGYSP